MKLPDAFTKVTSLSKALSGLLFILFPFIAFYLGYDYHRSITVKHDSSLQTVDNYNKRITTRNFINTPVPDTPIPTRHLPKITTRIKGDLDTSSWQSFQNKEGYSVSYPPDWFLVASGGQISTIQNYDPKKIERPLPFRLPKWDVSFYFRNFSDINTLLATDTHVLYNDLTINKIGKSSTTDGMDVYFIEGTVPDMELGGDDLVLDAIIVNQRQFIIWHGYNFDNQILELLKQIAESVRKSK
jgi:hypothetical protein